MNKQEDPKTQSGQNPNKQQDKNQGNHGNTGNTNENFDKGHKQSGYPEKEPRQKPDQSGQQPKVTNEDNDITNSDKPEIDTPVQIPEKTEKKIPSGGK
ncbi:hypothetical protein HHL16_16515 [Pseudoflavitalea sp. G-6-1-2]|uniref:hypothetical protein n=1 Tax=Pseudoflavitalea sp. G-6-1-2 TaxID=2728841 RepID=UPI00146C394F|nr:hypothetical protein [Pseudoflavitalea sp. G-6-1-2]NML22488.1 hypothetical protein [Pseudoflavitalea sp. G-6-1-2]